MHPVELTSLVTFTVFPSEPCEARAFVAIAYFQAFPSMFTRPRGTILLHWKKKQIHGYAASKAQPGTLLQLEGLAIYSLRAITTTLIKPRYNQLWGCEESLILS